MKDHKYLVFSFADVEVREREFSVIKAGEVLTVEPKAFRVLLFLLRRPHTLVTKDELLDAVWNDVSVSENSLTRNIALLRRLLGDDTHEPRYIATVPTIGYRFLCDVKVAEDGFRGLDGDHPHPPPPTSEVGVRQDASVQAATPAEARYQTAKEIAIDLQRMADPAQRLIASRPKRFGRVARFLWAAIPILALTTFLIGWVFLRNTNFNPSHSIAVLPFMDDSKDASTQYISDGITEGVIDKLSEIPSLRVMSRNSVFRFKGKETDAQSVGRYLHVRAVLTARIARQGDTLRLSAELVNVSDGAQIWGRQFRYSISDLSRVQDDLAAAVSDKLQLSLTSAEGTRLTKRVTDNSEAYQLYLQARFHLNQRTGPGIEKSVDLFQQATEKDPTFALAYAGLADAYNFSTIFAIRAPKESSPMAEAAATKALLLDPLLGEAHAALGLVKSHYDYDFPGAQREFLEAIKLNPNYANAHLFYAGAYLTPMSRHQEAIAEMKKALALDPLSLPLSNYMGNTYLFAGEYEKAFQQFQHTIDLDPTFPLAHFFFADLLVEIGKYEQGIKEYQTGALLAGASPEEASAQAAEFRAAFQTGGPKGYWQKILDVRLKEYQQAGPRYVPAWGVAVAYARVDDNEKALEWLQKSYAERDPSLTLVKSYPEFRSLRGDPRFADLLRRIGLPEWPQGSK
jgi:TolB-like protein/DNA-binding winged helix-turn-helix (wHTH) protein